MTRELWHWRESQSKKKKKRENPPFQSIYAFDIGNQHVSLYNTKLTKYNIAQIDRYIPASFRFRPV